jgi:hypothetical protein
MLQEMPVMAIAVLMEFPNVSPAQYDAVIEEMNLRGKPALHQIAHIAGPTEDGGWRVVDVWESEEDFRAFAESQIVPLTAKQEIVDDPVCHFWPVHNLLS